MGFLYETHLHTCEVSRCGVATPAEQVEFYHSVGYSGLVVTEHYFNGNCAIDRNLPWNERVDAFTSSYYHAKEAASKYDMDIMFGYEYTLGGTDFLVYGITPDWLKAHPDQMEWEIRKYFRTVRSEGAVVIQAHPFREAGYIDMIRLLPREVDGVEVYNSSMTEFQNAMANQYAENYKLPKLAGSDNHTARKPLYGGIEADRRYTDPKELIMSVIEGRSGIFHKTLEELEANIK